MKALLCACALLTVVGATAFAHHRAIRGRAIYYSDEYAGQTTACGGTYDPDKYTAAHRKLPCGTRLRVKNLSNDRRVIVRVTDRGPYGDDDTILDLSRAAARDLGYIRAGSARVKAVILHD